MDGSRWLDALESLEWWDERLELLEVLERTDTARSLETLGA
jgi:hypothetical protein